MATVHPLHTIFNKKWPLIFSTSRKPRDGRLCLEALVEALRTTGDESKGDDCIMFMETYEDDLTSSDTRNAIRYLQAIGECGLHEQSKSGKKATGWLDDRTHNRALLQTCQGQVPRVASMQVNVHHASITDSVDVVPDPSSIIPFQAGTEQNAFSITDADTRLYRSYKAPLSAQELHDHLRERQFDHITLQDADRRLVYLADPDAYDLMALIKTARPHQHRSLKDAICKFLALDTSIQATVAEGYTEFQLEFHIPYFAMRRSRPEKDFGERKRRSHRGWMNMAFLDTMEVDPETDGVCGIHQAQISVSVSGTDNSRWTAYCFEDRHFDEDGPFEDDEQTSDHQSDQVARGEWGAETTIWDPREYFLRVFLIRMRQVKKEWVELVSFIESGIKAHSWGRFFFAKTRNGTPPNIGDDAASNCINFTLALLGKLTDDLATINAAWASFTSPAGDIYFFSDIGQSTKMEMTFHQLSDIFGYMARLEYKLRRMVEQCEKRAQTLNLRLTSESKRSAELTIYFISPFAIVSTFFAIPKENMGFDRTVSSFFGAMLLYTLVLQALLFLWGGRLSRQQWWQKLLRRAKTLSQGDPSLIAKTDAGPTLLRRRTTHAAFV